MRFIDGSRGELSLISALDDNKYELPLGGICSLEDHNRCDLIAGSRGERSLTFASYKMTTNTNYRWAVDALSQKMRLVAANCSWALVLQCDWPVRHNRFKCELSNVFFCRRRIAMNTHRCRGGINTVANPSPETEYTTGAKIAIDRCGAELATTLKRAASLPRSGAGTFCQSSIKLTVSPCTCACNFTCPHRSCSPCVYSTTSSACTGPDTVYT